MHLDREESNKKSAALRLSHDELTDVLNDAIARQSKAEYQTERPSSLEDALEVARQLAIPEEHVLAAAQELQRRRLREQRRTVARDRRQAPFLAAVGLAIGIGLVVMLTRPSLGGFISVLLVALPALYLGWRWRAAPVTDAEADRTELPTTPGHCRVCGATATTPRSTFCSEHEYRAPGAP
jgi:Flp pilus assembly protein TadB